MGIAFRILCVIIGLNLSPAVKAQSLVASKFGDPTLLGNFGQPELITRPDSQQKISISERIKIIGKNPAKNRTKNQYADKPNERTPRGIKQNRSSQR